MRIQNNITAMNTHRMYTANNNAISKSAEKLSSGYRINRAGDDAAGLAISEKMRSQIRGLNMASKNSQDANSLIQTAEGALQEVHSMLQRMNELANQSATGTNENFDRTQISAEFDQLKNEINDISTQTNFNNMKLLDGTLASGASKARVMTGANSEMEVGKTLGSFYTITGQTGLSEQVGTYKITQDGTTSKIKVSFTDAKTGDVKNTDIDLADVTTGDFKGGGAFKVDLSAAGMGTFEMTANAGPNVSAADLAAKLNSTTAALTTKNSAEPNLDTALNALQTAVGATGSVSYTPPTKMPAEGTYKVSAGTTPGSIVIKDAAGNSSSEIAMPASTAVDASDAIDLSNVTINGKSIDLGKISFTNKSAGALANTAVVTAMTGDIVVPKENPEGGALKIQVGANEGEQLSISIEKMNVDGLGLTDSKISDQTSAGKAITATQDAINLVSEQRSTLGAMQNRLEHKISNLDNTSENLSASESRIRDVDIAKEMTSFTKNQILSQAATAMLAQANSMPQNVLSLMQ